MKTIGIIGGMSWESTILYYQWINREIAARCGGLTSAKLLIHSMNFAEIAALQRAGDWPALALILSDAARQLKAAGADCVLIATNTMHLVAPEVSAAVDVPLIHIVDVTADAINEKGVKKVGLLGTSFTMEQSFYSDRLRDQGICSIIPEPHERAFIHKVIFEELCRGECSNSSRDEFVAICKNLQARGAEGIIFGCTEITLLLSQHDLDCPIFDTTRLHALAAAGFALSGQSVGEVALA